MGVTRGGRCASFSQVSSQWSHSAVSSHLPGEEIRRTTAVKLAFNQYTIEFVPAGSFNMPRLQLPVIQSFKAPGSDREIQLRLYNHVYIFTTTVATQTDPEVFFMNGKPARAVQPFRVVPKKPKEIVSQMAELELALAGQSAPVYNTQNPSDMQFVAAWPSAPLEEQQYQEVAAPLPEQPEQQEVPVTTGSVVRERISQETQTDIDFAFEDDADGTDSASASEDSNAE